jgi:outer membrane protein OmpA-like peptidoglycan-associated protein
MILLLATLAHAQQLPREQGFDASGLDLAAFDADIRDPLRIVRPGRQTQGDWFVGGLFAYANQPLVQERTRDGQVQSAQPGLDHLVSLHLNGGVVAHDLLRLDVSLPLHAFSVGLGEPQGFFAGDLRVNALVTLLQPDHAEQGWGVGVRAHLDSPTGAPRRFLGERTVSGGGGVVATVGHRRFTGTLDVGAQFEPRIELDNLRNPDHVVLGLGLGLAPRDDVGLTLETRANLAFARNALAGAESPVETTLSARVATPQGGHFVAGASAGLPQGVGAARFRVFVGGGYGKVTIPPDPDLDTDGDGILDTADACPEVPETFNGHLDEDGCPDALRQLTVSVAYEGTPFEPGGTVRLVPDEGEPVAVTLDGPTVTVEVLPTLSWSVTGAHDCLEGSAATGPGEGEATVDLVLAPQREAVVRILAHDTDGRPVPDTTATLVSDGLGCGPDEVWRADGDGRLEGLVGAGGFTLFVEAPEHRIHRDTVLVPPPPSETELDVTLEPTRIELVADEIKILEKVYFDTDRATIQPRSYPLLQEVADTLLAYPRIARVEVQGHTDSRGSDDYNLDLSQRRADAVRTYLIEQGVQPERLAAVGYGETEPVASNNTSSGREKNRRVQFLILEDTALEVSP